MNYNTQWSYQYFATHLHK